MLLDEYQDKLCEGQENVTITESDIYAIEVNHILSN